MLNFGRDCDRRCAFWTAAIDQWSACTKLFLGPTSVAEEEISISTSTFYSYCTSRFGFVGYLSPCRAGILLKSSSEYAGMNQYFLSVPNTCSTNKLTILSHFSQQEYWTNNMIKRWWTHGFTNMPNLLNHGSDQIFVWIQFSLPTKQSSSQAEIDRFEWIISIF